jgi:endonuclease YncB( thermonuclease family)
VHEKWSKRQLITELKKDKVIGGPARADKTKPRAGIRLSYARGTIGVYRVAVPQGLQIKKEEPCLDLGFDVYRTQIAGIARRQHGDLVEVTAEGNARLSRSAGKSDLYTYKAYTERVVDGDTVWVVVEAGFDIVLRQKLRLRGINAPEMNTKGGKTAKAFLKRTLDSVEFIVIKTHGGDKYDRYLAGIFYLPGENDPQRVAHDGIYLNQELLDHGLVDLYLGEG